MSRSELTWPQYVEWRTRPPVRDHFVVTDLQPPPYQPPPYQAVYVQAPTTARNGFGIASLILAIFGMVFGGIPLFIGLFLSFGPVLLAITFGIIGIVRSSRVGVGFGVSLAGLIIGGLTFLLWFVGYGTFW